MTTTFGKSALGEIWTRSPIDAPETVNVSKCVVVPEILETFLVILVLIYGVLGVSQEALPEASDVSTFP